MSMNKIYSSSKQEIYFDESRRIMKNIWLTKTISFEDMKEEMHKWMEVFNARTCKFMLTDNRIGQIVVPEIQDWIIDFLFPTVVEKGVKKYAILVSDEIFSKVSSEQMFDAEKVEEHKNKNEFQQLFFNKEEEGQALNWLN